MKNKNRKKMSLTMIYLSSFGAFILGFFIIFTSPMLTGGQYKYPDAKLNAYEFLNNDMEIALVKKEYNSTKKIMRLDFSIRNNDDEATLNNIKFEVSSKYIKGSDPLDVKLTKVNDNYLVVLINDLPENYSVVATTLVPEYIHPEIEEGNDLEDRSVKFYINESEKIANNKLKQGTKKEYEKEYIDYQQADVKKEIAKKEKEIKSNELAVKETKRIITELEKEMEYQTDEEKFETTNKVNSYQTAIQQYETEINTLTKTIDDLHEKIKLLDEKRGSI